jgi:hypothetical protein
LVLGRKAVCEKVYEELQGWVNIFMISYVPTTT